MLFHINSFLLLLKIPSVSTSMSPNGHSYTENWGNAQPLKFKLFIFNIKKKINI